MAPWNDGFASFGKEPRKTRPPAGFFIMVFHQIPTVASRLRGDAWNKITHCLQLEALHHTIQIDRQSGQLLACGAGLVGTG